MQTCRFCKSWKRENDMIKYGVRHYAHFECYVDAGKHLRKLHGWQVRQFPKPLLERFGLLDEAKAVIARDDATEATYSMRHRPRISQP